MDDLENFSGISLDHTRVACSIHLQPFQAHWPRGYSIFALEGIKMLMEKQSFQQECEGKVETINGLLRKKPICCRLDKLELILLYQIVHITLEQHLLKSPFRLGKCELCRAKKRLTCEFTARSVMKGVQRFKRLCFVCLLENLKVDPSIN